jgi:hypothetical protein
LSFPSGTTSRKNDRMNNETGPSQRPPRQPRTLWSWATTPPQSYAVYLVCLILVFLLSFYAGTLKPKKAEGLGPPLSLAPPR